jgi:hypothetical protein
VVHAQRHRCGVDPPPRRWHVQPLRDPAADAAAAVQDWLDDVRPHIDLPEYTPGTPLAHAALCHGQLDVFDLALDFSNETEARYLDADTGICSWCPRDIEHDDALSLALAEWLARQCGPTESLHLPTGRVLRVTATGAVVLGVDGREVTP